MQERQAERAVEALRRYLPLQATAIRDGTEQDVDASEPRARRRHRPPRRRPHLGRRPAARRGVELDLSALTGESQPVLPLGRFDRHDRAAARGARPRLQRARHASAARPGPSSSRPACAPSSAGSRRSPSGTTTEQSPLELEVRRVAWLIALVALVAGLAFLPVAGSSRASARRTPSASRSASSWRTSPRGCSPRSRCRSPSASRARPARRSGQAALGARDSRLHDCHLHGQDRHADREPDAPRPRLDTARRTRPRKRRRAELDCRARTLSSASSDARSPRAARPNSPPNRPESRVARRPR